MQKLTLFLTLFLLCASTAWAQCPSICNTNFENTFLGSLAGNINVTGSDNVMVGQAAGRFLTTGNDNTVVGRGAGLSLGTASRNVIIGNLAGRSNAIGSGNVFIGDRVGESAAVSDRLYIDNFNTSAPLIYGEFDNNLVRVNGDLEVTGSIQADGLSVLGNNIFLGEETGTNNTGTFNTFVGDRAGQSNTSATRNAFFGADTGLRNTTGARNSFFGTAVGTSNTEGELNAFFGFRAGLNNTTGSRNVYLGNDAGFSNQTGSGNVFLGNNAGRSELGSNKLYVANTSTTTPLIYGEFDNSLVRINGSLQVSGGITGLAGFSAQASNTFGGLQAGASNNGTENTFFGQSAGQNNTSGSFNSFFGREAGLANTTGDFNAFFGRRSGLSNTEGNENAFFGVGSGRMNTTGRFNTFIGTAAGRNHTTGDRNTYVGRRAGANNPSGSGNVFIGDLAGQNAAGSNQLYIANSNTANPLIYGEFDNKIVNINGSLGVGIQNPERPIHLRATNAIFRIDRDRNDPGFAIVRYDQNFQNVFKSFYFYNRARGENDGKFVIADWGTNVAGPSTPRLVIANDGNIGVGPRFEQLANDPTARLHVDGDVRLENLPNGSGRNLVVDGQGNVFVSNTSSSRESLATENEALQTRIAELETKQAELMERLARLESREIESPQESTPSSALLYQNHPNPFGEETTIRFNLPDAVQSATLFIYDMQGTQLKKVEIQQRGEASVKLQAGSLRRGMYLYSLVADGQEVDMKRMMITD